MWELLALLALVRIIGFPCCLEVNGHLTVCPSLLVVGSVSNIVYLR